MNWDQIENNWLEMTRRIRPERPGTATLDPAATKGPADLVELPLEQPDQTASAAHRI